MYTIEDRSFVLKIKAKGFHFISKPNPFTIIGYKNKDEFINNQGTVIYSQAFNYFETEQPLIVKHKFDFLKPNHLYNTEQLFQDMSNENENEQQTYPYAHILKKIKKDLPSFTDQYICNLVMCTEHPKDVLEDLMESNYYPYEITRHDTENIYDYFNNDVKDNDTVDKAIRKKQYNDLTPDQLKVVYKLYFDYCLTSVLVEFESHMYRKDEFNETI